MNQSRRNFLNTSVTLSATALIPSISIAAGQPELQESDPIAVALGYKKKRQHRRHNQVPEARWRRWCYSVLQQLRLVLCR